ncbi:hypothetical protein SY2F82_54280 [Streptomyces sp. Y2F8-2]|nr:hypothetical protein SY2F82_54280 [Streptomyces sp. Y2F8-2]
MLRLSVAITVTTSTVVTPATAVVRPQSCMGVRLEYYGPVRVTLRSNGDERGTGGALSTSRGFSTDCGAAVDATSNNCDIRRV